MKRLINEPSAAALYHSHADPQEEQRLLIVDFGGGTLDVSVVDCFENVVNILAVSGDSGGLPLWNALLCASAFGLACAVFPRRKRRLG